MDSPNARYVTGRPFRSPEAADREARVLPLARIEVRAVGPMQLQLVCRQCGEVFYQFSGDVAADVLLGAIRDHVGAEHLLRPPAS